jgi:hypothetical protein
MRVYVVRKWPLRGRSHFVFWNITRVSLWLLCNVHFVRNTQRIRLKTKSFVRGVNSLPKLGVCASRNQVVAHWPLEDEGRVRASFLHSPKKSTRTAAKGLSSLWYPSSRVQTRPKQSYFSCEKNPQHAFLRRGSKSVCPMSRFAACWRTLHWRVSRIC